MSQTGPTWAAWVSDRLFADSEEVYDHLKVLARVTNGKTARMMIRWYKEGQDFDDYLKYEFVAETTSANWTEIGSAIPIVPPRDALFFRIYLEAVSSTASASNQYAAFDGLKLHGQGLGGPRQERPVKLECNGTGFVDPTVAFDLAPQTVGTAPALVTTRNRSTGGSWYEWTVSGPGLVLPQTTTGEENPLFVFTSPGAYTVTLKSCVGPGEVYCDEVSKPVNVTQ
jgi:hypothetical protein